MMFVWGAVVYVRAYSPPADADMVYVVGKQWMWKFQHPEGQREINTLHVPVGRPIKLLLTSEDVIHSFFVPAFRVHMDVLPDRYTSVWFQVTTEGTYHSVLLAILRHEPRQDDWPSRGPGAGCVPALAGLDGRGLAGAGRPQGVLEVPLLELPQRRRKRPRPVLERLFQKRVPLNDGQVIAADEQYLRESILHAGAQIVAGYQNIMPTFAGQINEEEVIRLIAYIKALEAGETPSRVEDFPPPVRADRGDADVKDLPGAESHNP